MNEEPMAEPVPGPSGTQAGDGQAPMSEAARATNIFLSPGETFEDINRKPTWIVPLVISLIFTLGFSFFFRSRVMTDEVIEQITRQKLEQAFERRGGTRPPEDVIQQQIRMIRKVNQFWYVSAVVGLLLLLMIVSGAYFLILVLMQANARFKKVFSVVSWSWMPQSVIGNIAGLITVLLRAPDTIDPNNPIATNLAAALSRTETPPFLYAIAGSLDVFSIWFLILLMIGVSKMSKKVSIGKAAAIVFGVWVIYVLCKAGFASFQGGM
jgi:hypothetical protein